MKVILRFRAWFWCCLYERLPYGPRWERLAVTALRRYGQAYGRLYPEPEPLFV